ncbi:hypothetical protein SY27_08205 [Flavobacterium sp. 316]|uniref:hypothetical protein n=1 Tax=Flavobacterium sp. 316 TaxID=1603293 RepID=UPI0005DDCBF6|nr:hypothetical protein [Flavobacterium sp. 316]KIX21664.1 hypothetical protein SY27_08205 [Flavobacterium sp. 316]
MKKYSFLLFLILLSCEKSFYNSKKVIPKEEYKYYNKDFVLPKSSLLKTNGIYISISEEKFEYKVDSYKINYPDRDHPALKGNIPNKDTIIFFNRYFYYQFTDNGLWKESGGYYNLEDLTESIKKINTSLDYSVYKVKGDSLFLESYNWYRKKFTYRDAVIIADTIFSRDRESNNKENTVKYIYYPINL